jgi:hypothetical protein
VYWDTCNHSVYVYLRSKSIVALQLSFGMMVGIESYMNPFHDF